MKVEPLAADPQCWANSGWSEALTEPGRTSWRLYRWLGLACSVGVLFLVQDLTRALLDLQAIGNPASSPGWLDLSGASVPASWLYWAGHFWVIAFMASREARASASSGDWVLCGVLAAGLVGVHIIVLGPLRGWVLSPHLL